MKNNIESTKNQMTTRSTQNDQNKEDYWSKNDIKVFKESTTHLDCPVQPLEHYHTMLVDEKYQNYEFKNENYGYYNIRSLLIDMLNETGRRLRQSQSTVNLAIRYTDIILNTDNVISQSVPYQSFKIIAVVCLNIASKFDTLDLNTPFISELQRASGVYIPYSAMVAYEREWLSILNWNLNLATCHHFVDVIKQHGFIWSDDTQKKGQSIEMDLGQALRKANILADYFSDLVTKDARWLKFKPSHLAWACILATRSWLHIDQPWSDSVAEMLVYEKDNIFDIYKLIEENYGYLMEAAESIWANSSPKNRKSKRSSRKSKAKPAFTHNTSLAKAKLTKRLEKLNEMHDYTDKFVVKPIFMTSETSEDSIKHSDNSIDMGPGHNQDIYDDMNGLAMPYDLDADELSYIEQTLQNQGLYDKFINSQGRSASTGPQGIDEYKRQISSLLRGQTKGSSGKENDEESPFYDSNEEYMFEPGKPQYMVTDEGELIEIPPELLMPLSQHKFDNMDQNVKITDELDVLKPLKQLV